MKIEDSIKKGRALIADYQWAMVCMDEELMDMFAEEKRQLDLRVMRNFSENDVCKYFKALS